MLSGPFVRRTEITALCVFLCFFLGSLVANAQNQKQDCAPFTFHFQKNDSNAIGQLHPQLQEWLLRECKQVLHSKGYCESDSGALEITLFIWLSTEERVVYEEMFTGSPHQLGVAIPHDLGYRSERIESMKYINMMLVMKSNQEELIWNNHLSKQVKDYKSKNAEKRSKRMAKKLVKGIPEPVFQNYN